MEVHLVTKKADSWDPGLRDASTDSDHTFLGYACFINLIFSSHRLSQIWTLDYSISSSEKRNVDPPRIQTRTKAKCRQKELQCVTSPSTSENHLSMGIPKIPSMFPELLTPPYPPCTAVHPPTCAIATNTYMTLAVPEGAHRGKAPRRFSDTQRINLTWSHGKFHPPPKKYVCIFFRSIKISLNSSPSSIRVPCAIPINGRWNVHQGGTAFDHPGNVGFNCRHEICTNYKSPIVWYKILCWMPWQHCSMQVSWKDRIPDPFLPNRAVNLRFQHQPSPTSQPFGESNPVVLSTKCQGWWQIIPIIHVCQNGVDLLKLSDGTCKPQWCTVNPTVGISEHPPIWHGSMDPWVRCWFVDNCPSSIFSTMKNTPKTFTRKWN